MLRRAAMSSAVLKALARPSTRLLLLPRPPLPARQFTTTPATLKKQRGPRTRRPPNPPPNKGPHGKPPPTKGAAGTELWNAGPRPNADLWSKHMDVLTARVAAAADYDRIEAGVHAWCDVLDAGIAAGVPAARVAATVQRNRRRSARLRGWVEGGEEEDDGLRGWMELGAGVTDEELARGRREWLAERAAREAEEEAREEEEFRREVVGERYDGMSDVERERAVEAWEEGVLGRGIVGEEGWEGMGERERADVIAAWREQEERFGRDMFGADWDAMSKEEKEMAIGDCMEDMEGGQFPGAQAGGDDEDDEDFEIEDFDPEREGDLSVDDEPEEEEEEQKKPGRKRAKK